MPERQSFPEAEEATLKHWEENKTFIESVRLSEGKKPFVFYDGPPFATGLPHYGHLLAGTIKVRTPSDHAGLDERLCMHAACVLSCFACLPQIGRAHV